MDKRTRIAIAHLQRELTQAFGGDDERYLRALDDVIEWINGEISATEFLLDDENDTHWTDAKWWEGADMALIKR